MKQIHIQITVENTITESDLYQVSKAQYKYKYKYKCMYKYKYMYHNCKYEYKYKYQVLHLCSEC